MHGTCMATKTISIDMEAYRRLSRARRDANESFSMVIKRARWPKERKTCGRFLRLSEGHPQIPSETLSALDEAQEEDAPPENKWSD